MLISGSTNDANERENDLFLYFVEINWQVKITIINSQNQSIQLPSKKITEFQHH